ncbi:helix-turn-helix transcriptional regulator [Paenibacillus sp. IB182496]|uniref:Helix-turn-helix transcriptional regulator n=1 Tax=Paenibacillus sabuli TaxID=2772509 RepID=A0A927GQG1_9BACL|nr:helix-turn-helix domain-containing protein [Paenibacillus sabuli]MBD2844246.1 helix-turn-helix transcriptional regulator [Paenibacillus sabuli]
METWSADWLEPGECYGKVYCERDWKWDTRGRPFADWDLWYVWSGAGELERCGEVRSVGPGSCYLLRPGDETRGAHDPARPLTVSYIHFRIAPPEGSAAHLDGPIRYEVEERAAFEGDLTRYVEAMDAGRRSEARLLLGLLLLQLRRETSQPQEEPAPRPERSRSLARTMREVMRYVRQFPSAPHSVETLADRARLSPRYFSRRFRAYSGQTVEAFVIGVRIARAEQLLRHYGMNVSETAAALGYSNVYYFSRQFKRYRGVAPSALRAR